MQWAVISLPRALWFASSVTLTGITPPAQEKHWADSSRIKCPALDSLCPPRAESMGFFFLGKTVIVKELFQERQFMLELLTHSKFFLLTFWSKPHVLQCFTCSEKFPSTQSSAGPAEPVGHCQSCHWPRCLSRGRLQSFAPQLRAPCRPSFPNLSLLSITIQSFTGLFHTAKDMFPLPQTNFSMKKSKDISVLL